MFLLPSLLIITCVVVVPTLSMSSEELTQGAHGVAASQQNMADGALHSGEFHVMHIERPAAVAPVRSSNQEEHQNLEHSSNQFRSSNQIDALVAEQAARAPMQKALQRDLLGASITLSTVAFIMAFSASYRLPDADTSAVSRLTQAAIRISWGFFTFMALYLGSCVFNKYILRNAFRIRQYGI